MAAIESGPAARARRDMNAAEEPKPTVTHPPERAARSATARRDGYALLRPLVVLRLGVTGLLMGLANLVPGVSGGTMVLVMGFYDDFISSIADITRLQFTRRNILFLSVLLGVAGAGIAAFAGPMHALVTAQRTAMYALFVGLTLGGAPLLYRMMRPVNAKSMIMAIVGLLLMLAVAASRQETSVLGETGPATRQGQLAIEPHYGLDVVAGILSVSAMVLPGISGAYMLLIIGRYETILAAIDGAKEYVMSGGSAGDAGSLHVFVPVAIGVVIGLVGLSNLLKWLLHNHQKPTLGLLLGGLLGSVAGIWPFEGANTGATHLVGTLWAGVGFAITFMLSRLSNHARAETGPANA